MLAQRVLSAVVLAPLLLLAVAAGGVWYLGFAVVIALVASWELYLLLRRAGFAPLWPLGMLVVPMFFLGRYFDEPRVVQDVLALALAGSLAYMLIRRRLEGSLLDWTITWLPPFYTGLMLSYAVALRQLPFGDRWMFAALAVAWATDSGAYFAGSLLGRHPFFPHISPRKTLEGALGGALLGLAAGVALAWIFGWDVVRMAPLALIAALAAQVGDLAESFMKRQLKTKDAGQLIPGHGGMLDRTDSVIFVVMAFYFWAIWIGGAR